MEFCQKCSGILIVQDGKASCAACGTRVKRKVKVEASEKITKKEEVAVVNEKAENTNPIVEITCPECKNKKAYFWTMQTRSSDESETKFYKCLKCGHTWRVYR